MVLDWLLGGSAEKDPVDVPADEAVSWFLGEYDEQLAAAQDHAAERRDAVEEAMDTVRAALESLSDFEDTDGYAQVEDVVENIHRDRLQQVESFTPPEEAEKLFEAVDEFIDEFQTMTQKESMILERAGDPVKPVFDALKEVKQERDRLDTFLEEDYRILDAYGAVQDAQETWIAQQEQVKTLQQELADINTSAIRDSIEEKQEQLDTFRNTDAWAKKEEIEADIADLEEQRDAVLADIERACGKMERGLKKLLYAARNEDTVSLDEEAIATLDKVRSGDILEGLWSADGAQTVVDAVDAAVDALPDDMLGDRQRGRFKDGAETLQALSEKQDRLQEIQEQIAGKRDDLDALDVEAQEQALQNKIDELEDELQKRAERRKELRQQIDAAKDARDSALEELERILDTVTDRPVTITHPGRPDA